MKRAQWIVLLSAVGITGCQSMDSMIPWLANRAPNYTAQELSLLDDNSVAADSPETDRSSTRPDPNPEVIQASYQVANGQAAPGPNQQLDELIRSGQAIVASEKKDPAQLQQARGYFEQAIALDSSSAQAHHGMAIVADLQKDFPTAEWHYKQALSANPTDANLLNDLGYSYVLQNRLSEANAYLNQAMQVAPQHDRAKVNFALLAVKQGDRNRAHQILSGIYTPADVESTLAKLEQTVAQMPPSVTSNARPPATSNDITAPALQRQDAISKRTPATAAPELDASGRLISVYPAGVTSNERPEPGPQSPAQYQQQPMSGATANYPPIPTPTMQPQATPQAGTAVYPINAAPIQPGSDANNLSSVATAQYPASAQPAAPQPGNYSQPVTNAAGQQVHVYPPGVVTAQTPARVQTPPATATSPQVDPLLMGLNAGSGVPIHASPMGQPTRIIPNAGLAGAQPNSWPAQSNYGGSIVGPPTNLQPLNSMTPSHPSTMLGQQLPPLPQANPQLPPLPGSNQLAPQSLPMQVPHQNQTFRNTQSLPLQQIPHGTVQPYQAPVGNLQQPQQIANPSMTMSQPTTAMPGGGQPMQQGSPLEAYERQLQFLDQQYNQTMNAGAIQPAPNPNIAQPSQFGPGTMNRVQNTTPLGRPL